MGGGIGIEYSEHWNFNEYVELGPNLFANTFSNKEWAFETLQRFGASVLCVIKKVLYLSLGLLLSVLTPFSVYSTAVCIFSFAARDVLNFCAHGFELKTVNYVSNKRRLSHVHDLKFLHC